MKKWLIVLFSIASLLVMTQIVVAEPLTLNEISEAICRVKVSYGLTGSAGTGTCIGLTEDGQGYYILTNGHVVGNSQSATVEFFKGGYKTNAFPAQIVWRKWERQTDVDFAILRVSKSYFGQIQPRIIPLAPEGVAIQPGYYISAVGCPQARWAQGWEGHITMDSKSRIMFAPPPVGGQSGSGIVILVQGVDGKWYSRVGAVLTWRIGRGEDTDDGAIGGAIPISTLYNVMRGNYSAQTVSHNYKEASAETVESRNVPYREVSDSPGRYALGENNKLYKVTLDGFGSPHVTVPPGTKILTWDYFNSKYYEEDAQCRPGNPNCPSPYGNNPDFFGRRRPSPNPNPQPFGGDGIGGNPPNIFGGGGGNTPGLTPPSGGNPYGGVVPPSIGAPWPGAPGTKPNDPADIAPSLPPISGGIFGGGGNTKPDNEDDIKRLRDITEKYEQLIKDKATADKRIKQLESQLQNGGKGIVATVQETAEKRPFLSMIGVGIAGGIAYLVWKKFGRAFVASKIDTVEDLIEKKVTEQWGAEAGKESRQIMEGVEATLLNLTDTFLEQKRLVNRLSANNAKSAMATQKNALGQIIQQLEQNIANAQVYGKADLLKLINASRATEVAEKDEAGIKALAELQAQVEKLGDKVSALDAKKVVDAVSKVEENDKDTDVLALIKEMNNKLNSLQSQETPPVQKQ